MFLTRLCSLIFLGLFSSAILAVQCAKDWTNYSGNDINQLPQFENAFEQAKQCNESQDSVMMKQYELANFYGKYGIRLDVAEVLQHEVVNYFATLGIKNLLNYSKALFSLAEIQYKRGKLNSAFQTSLRLEQYRNQLSADSTLLRELDAFRLIISASLGRSTRLFDIGEDVKQVYKGVTQLRSSYNPGRSALQNEMTQRSALRRLNYWLLYNASQQKSPQGKRNLRKKRIDEFTVEAMTEPGLDDLFVTYGLYTLLNNNSAPCSLPIASGIIKRLELNLIETTLNRLNATAIALQCVEKSKFKDYAKQYFQLLRQFLDSQPSDFQYDSFYEIKLFLQMALNRLDWQNDVVYHDFFLRSYQITSEASPILNQFRPKQNDKQLRTLLSQRQLLNIQLAATIQEDEINSEKLAKLQKQFGTTEEQIRTQYPRYSTYLTPVLSNVEELQKQLSETSAILVVSQTKDRLLSLIITNKNSYLNVNEQASTETHTQLTAIRESVISGDVRINTLVNLSNKLGIDQLETLPVKQLYLLTDETFSTFPATLLRSSTTQDWLMATVNIERTLSLSSINRKLSAIAPPLSPRLSIAAPNYHYLGQLAQAQAHSPAQQKPGSWRTGRKSDGSRSSENDAADLQSIIGSLPSLDETRYEGLKLTDDGSKPHKILLGNKATQKNTEKALSKNWGMVIYSTHTVFPSATNKLDFPGLALTPIDEFSESDDGFLSSYEITNLSHENAVLVLAACDTAAESFSKDYVASFVNAFVFSGASQVLASHWKIDSQETVEFVSQIADNLSGHNLTEAISIARRNMSTKGYGPDIWAAFDLYY